MSLGVQQLAGFGGGRRAAGGGAAPQTTSWVLDTGQNFTLSTVNYTNDKIATNLGWASAMTNGPRNSGKRYYEITVYHSSGTNADWLAHGICKYDDWPNPTYFFGSTAFGYAYVRGLASTSNTDYNAGAYPNNSTVDYDFDGTNPVSSIAFGSEVLYAYAVDIDNGGAWFGKDNGSSITWVGVPGSSGNIWFDNSPGENLSPIVSILTSHYVVLHTGSDTCLYDPPSGFVYWDAT